MTSDLTNDHIDPTLGSDETMSEQTGQPDRTEPTETTKATEATEATAGSPVDGGTTVEEPVFAQVSEPPLGSDQPTWFDDEAAQQTPPAAPATEPPSASTPQAAPVAAAPVPAPIITGPAPAPIILGILGLVIAVTAVVTRAADLTIDWGRAGPVTVVGAGLLLVLFGLLGMRGRRRTDGAT
jgi:hypothetical protein